VERADVEQPRTIEDVYAQEAGRLWRALLVFTSDPAVASDAVAEAFAQVIARGDAVVDPARWVWRAGFKIAAGELKRRHGDVPLDPAGVVEGPTGLGVDLMRAIERLPARQRAVVVLHYLADLSTPEVGRTLGMATPTVRVHLTKARRRLQELMEMPDA
jgi:RNA polymerase sigma-70 factor (ECF subfamily)